MFDIYNVVAYLYAFLLMLQCCCMPVCIVVVVVYNVVWHMRVLSLMCITFFEHVGPISNIT